MADKVLIFDTTLRDGEQSPGVALTAADKMEIARQLEKLGVDIIEAGFPKTSPGDFDAVQAIAREIKNSQTAGLAHADPGAVDACWDAVKVGVAPRIHVFLSSSDIHIMHQLAKDKETVLEMARTMVARAAGYCPDVEFSPMDATRSDREYVYWMLEQCIAAGARTVNIPDTVGYTTPEEFASFIADIRNNVPNIDKARISVHCHNDLGLAVANSLAAVKAGARQVETCINGIGERAGNAALEEVVMAIRTRKDFFDVETNIKTQELYRTSRLVADLTGMSVQPNKAIVGSNAFRHQSGIHQDGVLKMRETYEIMDARDIGIPSGGGEIVLGKVSGRHGFKARLEELGYELTEEELSRAFMAFKELADKKAEIDDRDLEAIVADKLRTMEEVYRLDFVQVSCGDHAQPTATVRLIAPDGSIRADAALGTGPVDAVYRAINRIVQVDNELTEFHVKSVTEGIDAQGEVTIRVESKGRSYVGRGADTDIIVASAKAYMNALNRLLSVERRQDTEVRANP
jgi:2-isopropylmalate synthase